jgi:5-hydroxyisourate hydrolase-like protein (transthyretin family)
MEEPLAMEAIRQTALGISPVKVVSALTVDKTAALYGNSVSISAQLNLEDKSPAANLPLRIEGKSANDATWRVLGTAVTGVDGRFTTPILLGKATSIRIATDGTWERAESLSNEISILIDRTISISAPGTVKANSSFAISGVVRPRSAGAQISLMKFSAGAWKKVAIATTNEQGVFAFALEKEPRQVARYQIIVEGDQLWRQVAAPEFSIIIR